VNGVSKEKTGGFLWMWRSVLDRSIFQKEGIWYSTRLVASNFTQLAVCIFILLLGISTIQDVKGNYGIEKATTQVSNVIEEVIETSISDFQAITVTTELTNVFTSYLVTLENSGFFDCTNTTDGAAYVINELCQEDLSGSFNCSSLATAKDSLCLLIENPDLIQTYPETAFQLLETSQFNTTYMYYLVRSKLEGVVNDALASLYPEKANMLMVPLCIAVAVAVMAALIAGTILAGDAWMRGDRTVLIASGMGCALVGLGMHLLRRKLMHKLRASRSLKSGAAAGAAGSGDTTAAPISES
jgi:hypothetical protein